MKGSVADGTAHFFVWESRVLPSLVVCSCVFFTGFFSLFYYVLGFFAFLNAVLLPFLLLAIHKLAKCKNEHRSSGSKTISECDVKW